MSVVFKLSLRTIFHRLINHNTSIFTASHVPCTLQSETKTSKHHRISKQKESTYRPTVFRVLSCQFFIFFILFGFRTQKEENKKVKTSGVLSTDASLLSVVHPLALQIFRMERCPSIFGEGSTFPKDIYIIKCSF